MLYQQQKEIDHEQRPDRRFNNRRSRQSAAKIGEIVGNPKQQMKGVQKQIKGKTQKAIGNVKEAAKDADKHS